jgi:hypothetical protein
MLETNAQLDHLDQLVVLEWTACLEKLENPALQERTTHLVQAAAPLAQAQVQAQAHRAQLAHQVLLDLPDRKVLLVVLVH